MKFTFRELGINPTDYNGMEFGKARALIINVACDYIMDKVVRDTSVDEFDAIPSPSRAEVNMVIQCIGIYVNMASIQVH